MLGAKYLVISTKHQTKLNLGAEKNVIEFSYLYNLSFFNIWGRPVLTGCVKTRISMQAHGMRALKDSSKSYLASLTTPWLLNLSDRVN